VKDPISGLLMREKTEDQLRYAKRAAGKLNTHESAGSFPGIFNGA
jgi:hypothetical protein